MKIFSKRFQTELEFDDQKIIEIPTGLFGFKQSKRFCILELEQENSPFKWLQDIDDTAIALLITDPYQFFPEYNPLIHKSYLKELSLTEKNIEEDLNLFTIVKITKGGQEAFTNLRAPVLVNAGTMNGKQIILENEEYSVKTPLFNEKDAQAAREQKQGQDQEQNKEVANG